jgi:hypothetical protein
MISPNKMVVLVVRLNESSAGHSSCLITKFRDESMAPVMLKELFPQTFAWDCSLSSLRTTIQGDGMSSPMQICLWEKVTGAHDLFIT